MHWHPPAPLHSKPVPSLLQEAQIRSRQVLPFPWPAPFLWPCAGTVADLIPQLHWVAWTQTEAKSPSLSHWRINWVGFLSTVLTNKHMTICCLQCVVPHTSLPPSLTEADEVRRGGGREQLHEKQHYIPAQSPASTSSCLPAFCSGSQITPRMSILPLQNLQEPSPFPQPKGIINVWQCRLY